MARAILPTPGDEYLCEGECEHVDCAWIRDLLNGACRFCGCGMQSGDAYCKDPKNSDCIVHWACAVAEADARAEAMT